MCSGRSYRHLHGRDPGHGSGYPLRQLGAAADRWKILPHLGQKWKEPPGNWAALSSGRIVPTEAKPSELSGLHSRCGGVECQGEKNDQITSLLSAACKSDTRNEASCDFRPVFSSLLRQLCPVHRVFWGLDPDFHNSKHAVNPSGSRCPAGLPNRPIFRAGRGE